VLEQES
jgi:two-component system sensor histidine kinase/response regulator